MKKILVTGGTGYIGSHTVVELVKSGYDPIVVDNFCNSDRSVLEGIKAITNKDIPYFEGDCVDISFMDSLLHQEQNIAGVIHFAAIKAVGESMENSKEYHRNNVGSTEVLLKVMQKYKVSHLVFSSSACVYGQPDILPATEKTEIKPAMSPYGETKQLCEEKINDAVKTTEGLKAISLRYFNPMGAHPSSYIGERPIGIPNNLIPFMTQVAAGLQEQLVVFGGDYNTPDGTCIRDYLHVVDLAKAHVKALKHLETVTTSSFYDVFNLGMGKGYSVLEIIQAFEKANDLSLNYVIGERRHGDIDVLYANADKSKNILNWQTELRIEDALKDAWNWQKKISPGLQRERENS